MNPIVKNILAVVAGFLVGMFTNMGIITVGMMIIPLPEGADFAKPDSLHLLKSYHFITPFLAHAANAFIGALIVSILAASNRFILAMLIGVLTLIGGILAAILIPAPTWFIVLDLVVAYLPMAFLGWKLSGKE